MSRDWPTAAQACNSRELPRAFLVTERAHARADRAGGDEHDFPARAALFRDLADQLLHLRQIRLLPAVGEHAGAELHDDATISLSNWLRTEKLVTNEAICVEKRLHLKIV